MDNAQTDNDPYLQALLKSGLINRSRLMQVISEIESETGATPVSKELLEDRLIKANLITGWQNNKLREGRFVGFFLGKYKLLKPVGKGGMGAVYQAEHTQMQRQVAIKILPPALLENRAYLARFQQEARATAALDHPNIVRAYDTDQDGQYHYLVMEFVEGDELQKLVENNGPMEFKQAADYIAQAASGLHHAHERKMIHRDVKPANLLVTKQGVVKVLDLGVARIVDQDDRASVTLAHNEDVIGTVDYIAPEQLMDSHNVDRRADIYSLGCTLYFLLTGKRPFEEGTWAVRLMRHQNSEPPAISTLRPGTPPGLIAICSRMIAKSPDDRYPDCAAVEAALREWIKKQEEAEKTPVPPSAAPAANPVAALAALLPATAEDNKAAAALLDQLVGQGVLTKFQAAALTGQSTDLLQIDAYQILDKVEQGRLTGIYRGRHVDLKFPVCIKVTKLAGEAQEKKLQLARFQRESRIAVQVHHPHVVRSFQLGKDGDLCFNVFEDLQGESLAERMLNEQLSVKQACHLVREAALGLAHLHEMEIIHRNISPDNIWISTTDDKVKIIDLELAEDSLGELDSPGLEDVKVQDTFWGSTDYMAPEQWFDAKSAGTYSDIYSLGCTLYHALTGQVPFEGDTEADQMMLHAAKPAPSPSELNPDVPPELDAVVMKMMAKLKQDRYQNASEVVEALAPFVA